MTTRWTIPRESVEWIGPVTHEPADATLRLALLPRGDRPIADDWQAPTMLDGGAGVMADRLTEEHWLWAQLADNPETVVVKAVGIVAVE